MCSARWGQVLKVDAEYLSSNYAFILALLLGVQGNGRYFGVGGTAERCGHLHDSVLLILGETTIHTT